MALPTILDAAQTHVSGLNDTNPIYSITVGAGANRKLVVSIAFEGGVGDTDDMTPTGVTFNGVALSRIPAASLRVVEKNNRLYLDTWYLDDPTATTGNLAVTLPGAFGGPGDNNVSISAIVVQDAKSGVPSPVGTREDTGSPSAISTTLNSITANSLLLDFLALDTDSDPTADAGQTETFDISVGTGSAHRHSGSEENEVAGGSETMGWSFPSQSRAAHSVIAIEEAPAGGTTTLVADAAAYTWTPTAANLLFLHLQKADVAIWSWSVNPADLQASRQLEADAAAWVWTAGDADLTISGGSQINTPERRRSASALLNFSPGVTPNAAKVAEWRAQVAYNYSAFWEAVVFVLDAEPAAYVWTTSNANLSLATEIVFNADPAAYVWTPADAGLSADRRIDADAAAYVWTASDASLPKGIRLAADPAAWAWTAGDAGLAAERHIKADGAVWAWTPEDARTLTGWLLRATPAIWSWSVDPADFTYSRKIMAEPAAYVWTAGDALLLFDTPFLWRPVPEDGTGWTDEPPAGGTWTDVPEDTTPWS